MTEADERIKLARALVSSLGDRKLVDMGDPEQWTALDAVECALQDLFSAVEERDVLLERAAELERERDSAKALANEWCDSHATVQGELDKMILDYRELMGDAVIMARHNISLRERLTEMEGYLEGLVRGR